MKNTIKHIGTQRLRLCAIALLALIGFSFAACGNGTTGGAEGTFTLTGIPAEYNGKYIILLARSPQLQSNGIWGQQGMTDEGLTILTQINNGKAVIPLLDTATLLTYTGNDTFVDSDTEYVIIKIFEQETIKTFDDPGLLTGSFQSVTFSNGSATKSWNDIFSTW